MLHGVRVALAGEPLPTAPGVLQDALHPLNVVHFGWAVVYRALCTFSPDTLVLRRRRHHSHASHHHTTQDTNHRHHDEEEGKENSEMQRSLLSASHTSHHSHHRYHYYSGNSSRASSAHSSHHSREGRHGKAPQSRESSTHSHGRNEQRRTSRIEGDNDVDKNNEEMMNRSRTSSHGSRSHTRRTLSATAQDTQSHRHRHHLHHSSVERRAHSADEVHRRPRSRPRHSTAPPQEDTKEGTRSKRDRIEEKKRKEEEEERDETGSQGSQTHTSLRHISRHRRSASSSSSLVSASSASALHRSRSAEEGIKQQHYQHQHHRSRTHTLSSASSSLSVAKGEERRRSRTTSSSRGLTRSARGRESNDDDEVRGEDSSRASSHALLEHSLTEDPSEGRRDEKEEKSAVAIRVEEKPKEEVHIREKEGEGEEDERRLRPGQLNAQGKSAMAMLGKPPLSGRHTPRTRTPSAQRTAHTSTTKGDEKEKEIRSGSGNSKEEDREKHEQPGSIGRATRSRSAASRSHTDASNPSAHTRHGRRRSTDSTHSHNSTKAKKESTEEAGSEHRSHSRHHHHHHQHHSRTPSITSAGKEREHKPTNLSVRTSSSSRHGRVVVVSRSRHPRTSRTLTSRLSSFLHRLGRRDATKQAYLLSHVLRALPVLGLHWGCALERQAATLPLLLTFRDVNAKVCAGLAQLVPRVLRQLPHTAPSSSSPPPLRNTDVVNGRTTGVHGGLYAEEEEGGYDEDDRSYIYASPSLAASVLLTRTYLQLLCHSATQMFFFDDTIAALNLRSRRFGRRLTGWLLRLGAHTLLDMIFLSVLTPLLCIAADPAAASNTGDSSFVQKMCVTVPGVLNACLNSAAAAVLECCLVPWCSQLVNRALVTVCETTEYLILRRYASYNHEEEEDEEEDEYDIEMEEEGEGGKDMRGENEVAKNGEEEEETMARRRARRSALRQRREAREAAAHNAIVRAILYRVAAGVVCESAVEHPLHVFIELLRGRATLHLTGLLAGYENVPRDQCGLSWHAIEHYLCDLRHTTLTASNMYSRNNDKSEGEGEGGDGSAREVPWLVSLLRRAGANLGHEVTMIAESIRNASGQASSLAALQTRAAASLAAGGRPSMSDSLEYFVRSLASYSPLYSGVQFSILDKLLSFYMAVWVRLRRQS